MNKTPEIMEWGSTLSGQMSKGCQQCIKGEKLVVLVNPRCTSKCFYCPLSLERKQGEISYANERPFTKISDLLVEAKNMTARGASMTGGDPLELHSFSQTLVYCQALKSEYTKNFHIHAYTRGKELNEGMLSQITPFLDEIRFHVINLEKDFSAVKLAMMYDIDVGIEVPIIPTRGLKYYKSLIEKFESILPKKNQIYFINLNELEISETNYRKLLSHGLEEHSNNQSAVEGSAKLARDIVEWASQNTSIPVHFCALSTKDNIQLPNRLYRIAINKSLPSDVVIEEGADRGLLIRGVIRANGHDLDRIKEFLVMELEIPAKLIYKDKNKDRILTNAAILEEIHEEIKQEFSQVQIGLAEEYPSYDNLQTTFISFESNKTNL